MKIKVFIHAQYNEYEKTFSYSAHYCDMEEYGYTLLETRELEVKEPSYEALVNRTVKALRKKQEKVLAVAQSEYQRVQNTVDALLCLEHKVAPPPAEEEIPF